MVNASNFFDLTQLINELIGDFTLFIFLGIIAIFFIVRKSSLTHQSAILFVILFSSIIVATVYNALLWVAVVFVGGLIFYMALSKNLRRG